MTTALSIDDLIAAHVAGRLPEPFALVVATHVALSRSGRRRLEQYRAIGGALLEDLAPVPLAGEAWDRLALAIDGAEPIRLQRPPCRDPRVPEPLRSVVPNGFDSLPWRHLGPASDVDLRVDAPGFRTRLIKLKAGRKVPRHTHEGLEITVVLEGGFRDEYGHHVRGDLVIADGTVEHRPIADDDRDCLSLAVTDAPLRLTGPISRLLNPLIRI